jgi:hypothetical protein
MLTCKEASFLASKQMDSKLIWRERIALFLHVGLCYMCRRYLKGLKKLRRFMRKAELGGMSSLVTVKLPTQDRDRIEQVLQAATVHSQTKNKAT